MLGAAFSKIFGTKVERELKRMRPVLEQMNALEPEMQRASDAELRAKSEQFRRRIQERLAALPTDEQDPGAAEKLLAVGESARDARLLPAEHAAWSVLCQLGLNLDEAITKE